MTVFLFLVKSCKPHSPIYKHWGFMIINGRPRNGSTTRGEKGALDFQISLEHDINTTIKYLANKKILREVVNNKNSPF